MNISSRKSNYSSSSEDDLTVNREAKKFMKDQFTSWFSAQIQSQLDSGVVLDDVDVDLRLSVLKPIHATWIVSMYNHLSSSEGRQSIAKGWKKAGVTDVVSGSKKLPPEDPFEDLDVWEHCGLWDNMYLILTCSSLFRKFVVQTFFFENKMTLTTLSRNLMIFYHFPPSKSQN